MSQIAIGDHIRVHKSTVYKTIKKLSTVIA